LVNTKDIDPAGHVKALEEALLRWLRFGALACPQ